MKVNQTNCNWNYEELFQLWKDIDVLLDRAGHEDEAIWQEQVYERIKSLVINSGMHMEILQTYSQLCRDSGFVLTTKN